MRQSGTEEGTETIDIDNDSVCLCAVGEKTASLAKYARWWHCMSETFNSHTRVQNLDDPRLKELMLIKAEMKAWKADLMNKHPDGEWQKRHVSWQLDFDCTATLNGAVGLIEFVQGTRTPSRVPPWFSKGLRSLRK